MGWLIDLHYCTPIPSMESVMHQQPNIDHYFTMNCSIVIELGINM